MTARSRRAPLRHGKARQRKPHLHQAGAGQRWLDITGSWPDLGTGAEPDGAPVPLPGPGGSHHIKGKLRGEAA